MSLPPQREFGSRRPAAPAPRNTASAGSGWLDLSTLIGPPSNGSSAPRTVTPTKLSAVLWAAFGVGIYTALILLTPKHTHLSISHTAAHTNLDASAAEPAQVANLIGMFLLPLIPLAFLSLRTGALYSVLAHIVLRWLGLNSIGAYAIGGAAAAYAVVASWALQGEHLQLADCLTEIAAGLVAGAVYRWAAGTTTVWPAAEARADEQFA